MSRIPPSGHPENKYIVTAEQVKHRDYIRFNPDKQKWEVRYDAGGKVGQPILQPNLYEHLERIAYRAGRDIRLLNSQIAASHTDVERFNDQFNSLQRTRGLMDSKDGRRSTDKEISLRKMARDLRKVAPDLVEESLVNLDSDTNERGSATIIQMQLIQEANNNWDSRFPEDEHVWNFAAPRLSLEPVATSNKGKPTQHRVNQYFNIRRWPVWAQSKKVQSAIKASNLVIQEKPAPPSAEAAEELKSALVEEVKRERYTGYGGPAMFPFGETPYQQAYLSWRMEQDLADGWCPKAW